jgi:hypothetical protein
MTELNLTPGQKIYITISDGSKLSTQLMTFQGIINFGLPMIVGINKGLAVDTYIMIPINQIIQIHYDEKLTIQKI